MVIDDATTTTRLVALVYELLDAHDDTVRLLENLGVDPPWVGHVEYLQRLQRLGREILARAQNGVSE
jgi:hypothetical protein